MAASFGLPVVIAFLNIALLDASIDRLDFFTEIVLHSIFSYVAIGAVVSLVAVAIPTTLVGRLLSGHWRWKRLYAAVQRITGIVLPSTARPWRRWIIWLGLAIMLDMAALQGFPLFTTWAALHLVQKPVQ